MSSSLYIQTDLAGGSTVQCGCRLGCMGWEGTLAPPGDYDWMVHTPYAAAMRPYVRLLWPICYYECLLFMRTYFANLLTN